MKTETLINALRILALDIQSDDGIANTVVMQAANKIEDLVKQRDGLIEALDYTASLLEASGRTALTARQAIAIAKAKGEKEDTNIGIIKLHSESEQQRWEAMKESFRQSPYYKPEMEQLKEIKETGKRHEHADLIHAWAEGAEIEVYSTFNKEWVTNINPSWWECNGYRIKSKGPENSEEDYRTAYLKGYEQAERDNEAKREEKREEKPLKHEGWINSYRAAFGNFCNAGAIDVDKKLCEVIEQRDELLEALENITMTAEDYDNFGIEELIAKAKGEE